MKLEGLNKLAETIHQGNKERGFYENPKELGTLLMLVTSELGEALEAHRRGFMGNKLALESMVENGFDELTFKKHIKDSVHDEISDAMIRLLDLCGYMNLDIESHIDFKLQFNATRGKRHGKDYWS